MNSSNTNEHGNIQTGTPAETPKSTGKATKKARVAARKPHVTPTKAKSAKKAAGGKKAAKGQKKGAPARDGSKTATVIALLENAKGATLAELMKATGWQAHSVRGFISGTLGKKLGRKVESVKRDDERVYSISR
jgi:hypothetical protein